MTGRNGSVAFQKMVHIVRKYSKWLTVELHLSGLTGTTTHPDMQKILTIGVFFENRLHGQFEVGGKNLQTAVLGYMFVYVQIKHQ